MPDSPDVSRSGAARAEIAGRLSSRLAARVAHDLNNALAIFSGHFYLLRDGAEPLEEGLEAMENAAANIERLAKSLTSLGTLGLEEPAAVGVDEVVRSAVAGSKAGAVETDLDPVLASVSIRARAGDLEKALRALLENAREGTGGAPGAVRVVTKDEGDAVSIAVEDSGAGIPAEIRKRHFDPLFSTKGERGRGIGITLAKVAATIAGGSFEIEDRPAGGTRAILRIPKSSPTPSPLPENEGP